MRNLQTQDLWVLPHACQRQYIVQLTFFLKKATELILEKQRVLLYLLGSRLIHKVITKKRNGDRQPKRHCFFFAVNYILLPFSRLK